MSGAASPKAGDTLAGKYRLDRVLGEGGMGTVFCAEHLRLKQPVAIKVLNPDMHGYQDILTRFDREARAAATLKSRHVVRVSDVETEGTPYMVMELLSGVDLESVREQRGKLPCDEVCDYVLQACDALAEAHEAGIVHRDLKPANLFLARQDDDSILVKVLDFGVSKILAEETKLTAAGTMVGTALYMSPEQIQGDDVDARSDIWALGVMLYELLAGDAPWVGPAARVAAAIVTAPPPDIRAKVALPEPVAAAIERMLMKRPADRPSSIAEVAAMLAPYAPPGSAGAQAAERIARRANRSISQPNLPLAPASDPRIVSARTVPMERSTDIGATIPNTPGGGLRPAILGALGGIALLGVLLVVVALAMKQKAPVAPAATAPLPTVSEAPAPSPAAAPTETAATTVASAAASGSAPKPKPAAAPIVTLKATAAPPASTPAPVVTKPPPAPAPKPTANPVFLQ